MLLALHRALTFSSYTQDYEVSFFSPGTAMHTHCQYSHPLFPSALSQCSALMEKDELLCWERAGLD